MNRSARFDVVQRRLGLGCARLGSVLGRDQAHSLALVQAAFDRGIRFFDTANIYGQGESERILGRALGGRRKEATIVTKAGQYFPTWMRMAKPFKGVIAPLLRRAGAGRHMVSQARQAPLPQNFSDHFLRASIEASLGRLNTDYADIVLLHSPPADVIAQGDALGSLERLREAGKAVRIGVSCEDVASALLALNDSRVEAIELPLWPVTETTDRFLDRAHRQAVFVIARGLMNVANGDDRWRAACTALVSSLPRGEISRVLIGTTRLPHLDLVLDAVRPPKATPCS
ncbi:aldo/keto reductase [Bradyrhizobium sp. CCBAU 53421]|uniref:aldo/keto reductase n=1 Tax=Bradyrhizobium sp. CCBAU 53421 TaxID=1325120 RepID=UPI00188A9F33|nr:aldo/keto reductase [Bradyrhizobium sp. CCBAU 53421]QOZ32700.1 aldo/keto reductase [Bradyrhizobium sp. CCBAU 53421]